MKVLLSSVPFSPSVGGIETVSAVLAEGLSALGCEVVVVTRTLEEDGIERPFRLVRGPAAHDLLKLVRWSDVVFHNNINLREAWPLLFTRKPWVIAHHMWLPRTGRNALLATLKRLAMLAARNIAVSRAMADDLSVTCTIVPNPYDSSRFRILPDAIRLSELIFVGRLVSDKGVALLLEAMALLNSRGVSPRLTIVGGGPEETSLRAAAIDLRLTAQVEFKGVVEGEALVELLNAHQFIVIPSLWQEPFGVVALEGAACGCIPVGSNGGGLADAIGDSGILFARGDSADLADKLQLLLLDPALAHRLRSRAPSHLGLHSKQAVAEQYRQVLVSVAGS